MFSWKKKKKKTIWLPILSIYSYVQMNKYLEDG